MVNSLTQTSQTKRKRVAIVGRGQRRHHRGGLTIWLGGGSTAQTCGDGTMSRTPVVNVYENGVDLEQQVLVVMIGSLLQKGQRAMVNSLVMVMWLESTVQGPSKGTMCMSRQRNRIITFGRSNRMLTPGQLQKPVATKQQED